MECIFCNIDTEAKSVEHIVSESLGNKNYVMQKGKVCDICNARFSKFEDKALTNSIFIMERARFGIKTKKGKNAKGKVNNLTIIGDTKFRPSYLTAKGLTPENFKNLDTLTQTGHLVVSSFDKSEVATSKLILKIGLESIYTSQQNLFNKYDFTDLKNFLTTNNNNDWPFLITDYEFEQFRSVPKFNDKYRLKINKCSLNYLDIDEKTLLFKFKYGAIPITLNLINRNLEWIKKITIEDKRAMLYPEHFRKKLAKVN